MYRAYHSTLLEFRLDQDASEVAAIAKTIAERGLNVLSIAAWQDDGDLVLRLVVDDMLRAADTLRSSVFASRERDVLLVEAPQRPGVLKHIASTLAHHDIRIRFLCASADLNQSETLVVLETSDNQRTRLLLDAWKLENPPTIASSRQPDVVCASEAST